MAEDSAASHVGEPTQPERPFAGAGPGVRIPSPLIHFAFLAAGLWLQRADPWPLLPQPLGWWLGALLVTPLSLVSFASSFEFARAGTSMLPYRPSRQLITRGPYRLSRNPIYLSVALVHCGIGIWINSVWVALSALPCVAILDRFVIPREERYLEQRFGHAYRAYARRVRRWL